MNRPLQANSRKTFEKTGFKISRAVVKNILICIFSYFCGTFFIMGGFNPTGVAVVASLLGEGVTFYLALLFSFLGYLSVGTYDMPLYIVCLSFYGVGGLILFTSKPKNIAYTYAYGGVCMFLATVVFGVISGFTTFFVIRGITESICVVSISLIIKKALQIFDEGISCHVLGADEILCIGVCIVVALGALSTKGALGFNIAICFSTVFLLVCAFKSGTQAVSIGVVLGLVFTLLQVKTIEFFVLISVATLIAGVFSLRRIHTVGSFVISLCVISFYMNILPTKEELFAFLLGGLIFLALPKKIVSSLNTFENYKNEFEVEDYFVRVKEITERKLKNFANAFAMLSEVFETEEMAKEVTPQIATEIVDKVATNVCSQCNMWAYCWQNKNYETYEGILKLLGAVEKRGMAKENDLSEYLKNSCVKSIKILDSANLCAKEYRRELWWQGRLNESKELLKEQLLCVENIISDLSTKTISVPIFYESLEKEIKSRLINQGIKVKRIYVTKEENGIMTVAITKDSCFGGGSCKNIILPVISSVTGRQFFVEEKPCSPKDNICSVVFKEIKGYRIKIAVSAVAKAGSSKSGDTYYYDETENKKGILALCDGMGSGEKAAKESYEATRLVKSFLRANFPLKTTMKVLNSALASNNKESYTTMDICNIDLFSGECEIIKNGGSTIFVVNESGIEAIRSESLPIGVLKKWEGEVRNVVLKEDDIIIMITDGVSDAFGMEREVDFVMKALKICDEKMNKLSATILKLALEESQGEAKDDMTVLVGKIY